MTLSISFQKRQKDLVFVSFFYMFRASVLMPTAQKTLSDFYDFHVDKCARNV